MSYRVFGPDRSFEEPEMTENPISYCDSCGVEIYFGDELTFKSYVFCCDDCLSEFLESNDEKLFNDDK